VAWIWGDKRQLFELFSEVTYADYTAHTNKEGRPFYLLTGKEYSNGESYIALWAFCPSERRWFSQWLYVGAIPHLLGRGNVKRMQLHLTDWLVRSRSRHARKDTGSNRNQTRNKRILHTD
jgi:hypothetical protein